MWTRFLIALSIAAGLEAQSNSNDLLRLVQTRVGRSAQHLPRFMCTETIDRTQYEIDRRIKNKNCEADPDGRSGQLFASDRLRLDVAVGAGAEIFAWAG